MAPEELICYAELTQTKGTKWDVPALLIVLDADRRWTGPALQNPSGCNEVVVTLAYPDAKGALLQNDVSLMVRAGDVERHGNMGSDMGFDHTSKSLPLNHSMSAYFAIDNVGERYLEPCAWFAGNDCCTSPCLLGYKFAASFYGNMGHSSRVKMLCIFRDWLDTQKLKDGQSVLVLKRGILLYFVQTGPL